MSQSSLKDLMLKRSSIKGQITKFKNYLEKISNSSLFNEFLMAELNLKLTRFENLSTKFDSLQTEIEVLIKEPDILKVELDEREIIESDFIHNIVTAKIIMKDHSTTQNEESRHNSSTCDHSDPPGIKLPQIQVSKFDGSFFRWLEFRDTFVNLVHKNERLTDIHKFHYLVSYLEGDAACLLSNLVVSSNNYIEAWRLLCERYDNKRLLINHHLSSLFNLQPLARESEKSLRHLIDNVAKNLRALSSLGQPTTHWDILIIFMISSKLDRSTLTKWEEHRNTLSDTPTLVQFNKFLADRADVLEALNRSKFENNSTINSNNLKMFTYPRQLQNMGQSTAHRSSDRPQKSFAMFNQSPSNKNICVICNESHKIYDCPTFKSSNIKERLGYVSTHKLCINCLRTGHIADACRMGSCRQCNQKHNTLLHSPDISTNNCSTEEGQNEEEVHTLTGHNVSISHNVLLSTALIKVRNPTTDNIETVRALLDCGSQSTFISKSLQKRLSLKCKPLTAIKVIGIGNSCSNQVVESCNAKLQSLNSTYQVTLSCLVLNEITGDLPKSPVDIQNLRIPKSIILADPNFNKPAPVELLIGADLFWDILGSEQRSLGPNNPKIHSSKFGWIIAGPVLQSQFNKIHCNSAIISNSTIDQTITKFWELEELPQKTALTPEEEACEKHFLCTTMRLENGRFSVRLPLKDSPDCLGSSYNQAKKRFLNIEKRFRKNPKLKVEYKDFIQEYAKLEHLSESTVSIPDTSYFLSHHAVVKEDSESTKLRVVFDGSAPTTSGFSVNDIQMVGPTIQDSLFSILIRARQHKYILIGDIAKMYRQVQIHNDDRNLQLILWREDESSPIKTLRLNTVTYGTASASYLSTRCLWQVGEECDDNLIKEIIQRDFYVDDLITGCDDPDQLKYIQMSVSNALNSACFPLRKYKTNSSSLFQNSESDNNKNLTFSESSSTLGLGWNPATDTFFFPTSMPCNNNQITKRFILSNSFKIFDPLGLVSPCIIQPKILLQRLWLKGIDWDQSVPRDIEEEWTEIARTLPEISNINIPRRVLCDAPQSFEIHCFSDASQVAYGACAYMRSVNEQGEVFINLLCAKSKVAPLKPITIPRLELCAALLSAKLCKSIINSIRTSPSAIFYWCDSSIVLGWISTSTRQLKTFVANRIGEILELTNPKQWHYVPTESNPADLISRGVNGTMISECSLWWHGPTFLIKNELEWPHLQSNKPLDLPELKANSTIVSSENIFNFEHFSSLNKVQRTFGYILRFINNSQNKDLGKVRAGPLSAEELQEAFLKICLLSQRQSFPKEYDRLFKKKGLEPKSRILDLSPFMDFKTKLIRVGGRLESSNYSYESKHPILLDSAHHLTKILFEREHLRSLHSGPQLLLSTIRQTIWPINGRKLARRVVKKCVMCIRIRGQTLQPMMGDLPSYRLIADFPFKSVGIDYAGPFFTLNRKGRGSKLIKSYLCLFICLRYKCIHLEAVSDLTKESFIMTLRRFVARRGKPAEVFSDNGRNFVAAAKDISLFLKSSNESISQFASEEGIKFKFIPAYAPHFGGIWEAGVKSAKFHIKRVMGNSHLTFEEICTLFAQVEAILNSRPLCPMSSCPDDLLSLSPGHFLIGRPLNALPTPVLTEVKESNLDRYARLEQIRQHFWQRWQREYVSEMQQRTKWKTNMSNLNIGDLVLLQEDNVPPLNWRLGRVTHLFPGHDGVPRVANIQTTRGCVRRPLVRLCPLPAAEDYLD